jgi:type IV secretory pathway ATPase VirB11/archaellum biosynthesis ATPase
VNSNIHVIYCPNGRCDRCFHRNDQGCQKLESIREYENGEAQIVLVEREKGLLHFCKINALQQAEPSWRTDGWNIVFVGINSHLFEELNNILSIYKVGPYLSIFKRGAYNEIDYIAVPLARTALEHSLIEELSHQSVCIEDRTYSLREGITQKLERITMDVSKHIMNLIPEINEITRMNLSELIAHRRSVLGSLMPIILDDLVEEIYLDNPGTFIYFDHQIYGRCITTITFQDYEVPKIVTLIRAESNLHLDRSNPSLKMDLKIQNVSLRFSASMPPLSPDGLHLEIRRARNQPFSVKDLIENGTMTPEAAAILLFAISCRFNITITGAPGTGKTTLLNALDMTTPTWWRKIYIEDAIESREQRNHHQIRFRVDPIDEQLMKSSKSKEIIKCLHRSPDYLILGEIQTSEHSTALFQAIIAGLRTIQTCHSDSASSLISRWKFGHGVQNDNLALMDVIVTLEKPKPGESKRRVSEIIEIRRNIKDGLLGFSGLNVVYDVDKGVCDNWSIDGAFMNRAREYGVESHVPALRKLIDVVCNDHGYTSLEKLSEKMWSYGHPMRCIEQKS